MFRNTRYGGWNVHLFMFQFVSKHFKTIESLDLEISAYFNLFQSVYYIIYMFQCFETPDMGAGIFTFLCFSLLKRFETIESVDLEIFSLFQFVSVSLLYNLYVSMFRNTRYGGWNFHLFMFQFVSKRFETIESVDLDIFSLYNFYVSMFRNKFETLGHILYI